MAIKLTEEQIGQINEDLKKKRATPTLSKDSFRANLESLGKETKFDYVGDFDKIKNSLLTTSYSPYTKKTYTYEQKQNMTEEDYFNDLMAAADYTENITTAEDVSSSRSAPEAIAKWLQTRSGKSFVYGLNEAVGGTALYKAINGEDALQAKLNQVENVYNKPLARGLGSAAGTIGLIAAGGELGSAIGGAIAGTTGATTGALAGRALTGGLSGGSRAYTYSNNPADILAGTATGATYGLISGAVSGGLKGAVANANPALMAKAGTDFGVNALASGAGAYAGTALSGTLGNTIRAAGGREVTPEEWISPLWSAETLGNVAVASVIGGTLGTMADRKALNAQRTPTQATGMTKEKAYKILGLKDNPTEEDVTRAARRLVFAYHSDTGGTTADTQKLNEVLDAKRFLQENKPGIFERVKSVFVRLANSVKGTKTPTRTELGNPYLPATTSNTPATSVVTAGTGLIPTYGQPTTTTQPTGTTPIIPGAVPTTSTFQNMGTNQPSNVDILPTSNTVANKTNDTYNEVIEYQGAKGEQTNGENNIPGVVTDGREGQKSLHLENDKGTIEKIRPNRAKTSEQAEILRKKIITDTTPEEKELINELEQATGLPVYIIDMGNGESGGMTSNDEIFLDRDTINELGGKYVGYHEEAENLLLNHEDESGAEIAKLVDKLVENEKTNRTATKLFEFYFKPTNKGGVSNTISGKTKMDYVKNLELFAKEMIFNTFGADKQFGKSNVYHELLGDTLYNDIVTTIDGLSAGKSKTPSKTSDLKIQGGGTPTFVKGEKPAKKPAKPLKKTSTPKPELAPEPPKNYTIEKQNKDIQKLEDANNKLKDQLTKKEEELRKAREQGKQALKKQKDESREKIKQLTFKKNEQRQEALRDARLKGKESLRKQREKMEAKKRAADQDKRAKTMPQKFDLAYDRLQDVLDKVYDKPASKELEQALKEVQKNSRGTIKLLDKVKKILPSKYNFFADDVLDIVETYYTGGNKMTDEKRASLEQKAKLIQDFIDQNPNFPISDRAKALLKEPNKKNIADLNERDLVSLAEDIQEIGIAVRDMFSFVRASEDAIKFREGALEYAQKMLAAGKGRKPVAKGYRLVEGARKYLDKRSTLKTMTLRLSGGNPYAEFNFMPNQLLAGYADYNKALDKLLKPWEKYTTYKKFGNVRKVSNKLDYLWNPKNRLKYGLKTVDGGTYHPSLRYALLVVYASQDPQFAGHTIGYLTDKFEDVIDDETGEPTGEKRPIKTKGGIARFANSIDEQFGETNKGLKRGVSVKLSIDDVNKMREELIKMPYVKEFLDTMKEFSDINYGLVNPTYEAINGQSLPKRDFYTPIRVDPAVRSRQKAIDDVKARTNIDGTTTLLNSGFVQPIVEGADGQILIYPMDEVIGKMMNNAALYAGYAARLYDINTFLNATTEDGKNLVELINELDPSYIGNYNKVAESIVVGNRRNLTSELASRYTNSILRANPWLALKQAGSYFTTAKYYDHPLRSMLAGAFNKKGVAKAIKEAYKAHGTDIDKLNVDETIRYFWDDKVNAELSIRARGWNSPDKYDILKHAGLLKRLKILDLYKGVDYSTIRAIAFAMVKDSMIDGKFDFDNDATFDELNNKFLAAHTETQPNTSAVTRAPIQNGNVADKILSFMKDPVIKEGNALADARMIKKWANKEGTKEQKQEANKGYWRAIVGTLASLAYITYVNNRKKTIEGKEDNNFIKDMIANGIALTVGVDQIAGALINEYSYDITAPDTQALNMLYNIGKTLRDVKDHWGDSYKLSKDADKIVEYLASFCGIPYKNIKTAYNDLLSLTGSSEYYVNKIKSNSNMYNKYQKYEDDIYDPEEFYEIYNATREKVVKENYGKYNNSTIKQAIVDAGGDLSTYYKMFKLGN